MFKGIPISTSRQLILQKNRTRIIHKLFWSYRMLYGAAYLFVAKAVFKKKLVVGPASFGPFDGLPIITKKIVKFVLTKYVDLIFVREPFSARILESIGAKNYVETTDAALTTMNRLLSNPDVRQSTLTVGFAPALFSYMLSTKELENYKTAHINCIEDLINERCAKIVFLPSSPDDVPMCRSIISAISERFEISEHIELVVTDDVNKYESKLRQLDLLVTTRMHPLILSVRNYIPAYTIIYDHKQFGVLQQIGLRKFCKLIGEISYSTLKQDLNYALDNRKFIKEILEYNLPKIQIVSKEKIMESLYYLATM